MLTIQQQALGIQHNLIPAGSQGRCNFTSSLESSEFQEALVLAKSFSDKKCRFGLSLGFDNDGLLLLDCLVNEERRTESGLLGNLLKVVNANYRIELAVWHTCLASTAWVNSGEKATCVMETSSSVNPKRAARLIRLSRTSRETYEER